MTRLGGGLGWWIWSLALAFVVYTFSFQTGYSIVNAGVQKDVGLSVSQVATIAAVYTWAFAISQFSAARCSIGLAPGKCCRRQSP
jgi:hypothetical protein